MELLHFINNRKAVIILPLVAILGLLSLYIVLTESNLLNFIARLGY